MPYLDLTKSEMDVLEVLWKEKRPLSVLEIINITLGEQTWSKSRVLAIVNTLTEKGLVESVGFVRNHKSFARAFSPTLSFEEFTVNQIENSVSFSYNSISKIFSGLLNNNKTISDKQKTIDELRAIIDENSQDEKTEIKDNIENNTKEDK